MASADTVSWTGDDAAKVTGGWITHPWLANGVSIDSRTVASGERFVALVGDRFDGHDYVNAALKAGAVAAMVSRVPDSIEMAAPLLVVPNTQTGLSALGAAGRARSRARVVGVTGSVGKTGTKEMLRLTLSAFGSVHASVRSYNNAIGVPLTLANLPKETDYAVVEIGMNHDGEIAALSELSRPHVAVVTTVAPVHLGNFNSIDDIASAKAEIFVGVESGGIAVLNRDNPFFRQLRSAAEIGVEQVIGFGCATDANIRLIKYDASPGCNTLTVEIEGNPLVYQLGADGLHWACNSLAVLGVIHGFGENPHAAVGCLADFQGMQGRGVRHSINLGDGEFELIDDSYNASPVSMCAALEVLGTSRPKHSGRRIAVLGDMLELGSGEGAFHAKLADNVAAANVDLTFTVGNRMLHLRDALSSVRRGGHAEFASQIITPVIFALGRGDVVLVKGSHGSGMSGVVDALLQASDGPDMAIVDNSH